MCIEMSIGNVTIDIQGDIVSTIDAAAHAIYEDWKPVIYSVVGGGTFLIALCICCCCYKKKKKYKKLDEKDGE